MSTAFPGAIDAPTTKTDNVDQVVAADIDNAQDGLVAVETKLGVDGSAVTTTIDYKVKNTASIDPGHKHTDASLNSLAYGKLTYTGLVTNQALIASSSTTAGFRAIQETDIATGSTLARLGSNQTITGTWTFNGTRPVLKQGFTLGGAGSEAVTHIATASVGTVTYSWPSAFSNGQVLTVGAGGALTWTTVGGALSGGIDKHLVRWNSTNAIQSSGWNLSDTDFLSASITRTDTASINSIALSSYVIGNPAGSSASVFMGIFGWADTSGSQNLTNTVGCVQGGQFLAYHSGTGTAAFIIGANLQATKVSSGPVTVAAGAYVRINNSNATNTIATGYGVFVDTPGVVGTISAYYPFYAVGVSGAVSIACPLEFRGSVSGTLRQTVPGTVTTQVLTWPATIVAGGVLKTDSGGNLSWDTSGSGGASSLSSVTAAVASTTIANGANTITWQWTLNAANQNGLKLEVTGQPGTTNEAILVLDRNGYNNVTALSITADSAGAGGTAPLIWIDTGLHSPASAPFLVQPGGQFFSYVGTEAVWDISLAYGSPGGTINGRVHHYLVSDFAASNNSTYVSYDFTTLLAQCDQGGNTFTSFAQHYSGTMRAVYGIARGYTKANGGTGSIANLVAGEFRVGQIATWDAPIAVGACLRTQLFGSTDNSIFANGYALLMQAPNDSSNTFSQTWGWVQLGSEPNAITGSLSIGSTALPAVSSSIDLKGTTTALLLNRMAGTSGVGTPVDGMIVYDSTAVDFKGRKGGTWAVLGGSGGSPALSSILAAAGSNSIANTAYQQTWNWALTTTNQIGLQLTGSGTSGQNNQRLLSIERGSSSYLNPLVISATAEATESLGLPRALFQVLIGSSQVFVVDGVGHCSSISRATNAAWDGAYSDTTVYMHGIAHHAILATTQLSADTSARISGIAGVLNLQGLHSYTGPIAGVFGWASSWLPSTPNGQTIATLTGGDFQVRAQHYVGDDAVVTTASAVQAQVTVGTSANNGVIVNGIGLLILEPKRVDGSAVAAAVTNKWGVRQMGAEGNSFGGPITVGSTSLPTVYASLDLAGSAQALLLNRVATTTPITTAVDGMILYDSTNAVFKGHIGGSWKTFTLT